MDTLDKLMALDTQAPGLAAWFSRHQTRIIGHLADYVAIDTTSPNEGRALPFLKDYLEPLGFHFSEHSLPETFWTDPERAPETVSKIDRGGKIHRAHWAGSSRGRHIIVNIHVDVVPLQREFALGFTPQIHSDRIVGRGTVDTKGNLIMLVEALRWLVESGHRPEHSITLDFVFEEEVGGNGALASVLLGSEADCCLVLEPTNGEIFRGHRGCVSFEAVFSGFARHMGDDVGKERNAIEAAAEAMLCLKKLEQRLDKEKDRFEAFRQWERALQINVGEIHGGDWYGSTPRECRIAGNCGFLPHQGLAGTQETLTQFFESLAADMPNIDVALNWPALRNESYLDPMEDLFWSHLAKVKGTSTAFRAWNVSCDGRHYARRLDIPTAIFGCGQLSQAHSVDETLYYSELLEGISLTAQILTDSLGAKYDCD
ncbi:M20/M25/M40 family metallo-hydrolase [Vibrio cholerae]|nr:M20/M25/M40 family metallo-hydrolase [Vibrio cholerae]